MAEQMPAEAVLPPAVPPADIAAPEAATPVVEVKAAPAKPGKGPGRPKSAAVKKAPKKAAVTADVSQSSAAPSSVLPADDAVTVTAPDANGQPPAKRPRRAAAVKRVIRDDDSEDERPPAASSAKAVTSAIEAQSEPKIGKIKLPMKRKSMSTDAPTPLASITPANAMPDGQAAAIAAEPDAAMADATNTSAPVALDSLFDTAADVPAPSRPAETSPLSNIETSPAKPPDLSVSATSTTPPSAKPAAATPSALNYPDKAQLSAEASVTVKTANFKSTTKKPAPTVAASQGPNTGGPSTKVKTTPKDPASTTAAKPRPPGAAKAPVKAKKPVAPIAGAAGPSAVPKPAAAAPTSGGDVSYLDSLFVGAVVQTDHDRQLKKEREQRAAAAKEAAAKANAAVDTSLAAKAAVKKPDNALNSCALPFKTKAGVTKPVTLVGAKAPGALPGKGLRLGLADSDLQARLAGAVYTRQDEINEQRAAAKQRRKELNEVGGFDLLRQGMVMSAFEAPFLREWNNHQQLAFQGRKDCQPFPFYNGKGPLPSKDDGNGQGADGSDDPWEEGQAIEEAPKSLQHPWTFGAAFVFAGRA